MQRPATALLTERDFLLRQPTSTGICLLIGYLPLHQMLKALEVLIGTGVVHSPTSRGFAHGCLLLGQGPTERGQQTV